MTNNIIYALLDPITRFIHYIGYTTNKDKRLKAHCKGNEGTKEKQIWIRRLKKQGLKPIMETIQEYETFGELPVAEEFWYGYFKLIGAELYNDPTYIGFGIHRSKGRTAWNKGKPMSESQKLKISELQKGKPLRKKDGTLVDHSGKTWKLIGGKRVWLSRSI